MQAIHPVSAKNKPQIKSKNKMILKNHFLDQDKSFQKLFKFRTWFSLPGALHLNMVCLTCDIYFGCFKKLSKN